MRLALVAAAVVLLNVPFGYWRANVHRFSGQWVLAVHLPVPAVVALRFSSGIGFRPATYAALVAAFFVGQYVGGVIHDRLASGSAGPVSSCLVVDLARLLGA